MGYLVMLWLDLTNAYGLKPNKVVEPSLVQHLVPSKGLGLNHYRNYRLLWVTLGYAKSDCHWLKQWIITYCTISVMLFTLAMNMLLKAAEIECRGPLPMCGV